MCYLLYNFARCLYTIDFYWFFEAMVFPLSTLALRGHGILP